MKNKLFNPGKLFRDESRVTTDSIGDARQGSVYVFDDDIILAVNVALATGRPILVRGPSGCGKSSLARSVANFSQWRYYERVITSRTQARDLLYEVDLLRRLHDAQVARLQQDPFADDYTPYIEPGPLWWAFNPASAERRGASPERWAQWQARVPIDHAAKPPCDYPQGDRAIVLLDEIDKADPDVPNNLLVPLGSLEFKVDETEAEIKLAGKAPLVFITTNEERDLPPAFLRRCVELNIKNPNRDRLMEIGQAHFKDREAWLKEVTNMFIPETAPLEELPSTAEYLDVLRAYDVLKPEDDEWQSIASITAKKRSDV
jgi:MoxR-like ATPase